MSSPSSSASTTPRSKASRKRSSRRPSTTSLSKTEIRINIYDLLPPGRLSSFLWVVGGSLLHSGVVINGREYAYGGHDKRGVSGVYWTRPQLEPPGGTFRHSYLQGFSYLEESEIEAAIHELSQKFQGTSYNLLTKNCNHFTSALCVALTGRQAPSWLNRAASIGLALPCVVPRDWIAPPDHETADGELLDDEFDSEEDEEAAMLGRDPSRRTQLLELANNELNDERDVGGGTSHTTENPQKPERPRTAKEIPQVTESPPRPEGPRLVSLKDTSGREMPASERAPLPRFS